LDDISFCEVLSYYTLHSVFTSYTLCVYCCICTEDALEGVSLDKFLARHTSEDNISFSEIMADAEKKRRLKHAWLYEKVDEQLEVSDEHRHCHHDHHHYYSLNKLTGTSKQTTEPKDIAK